MTALNKNMYELWRDKELPEKYQNEIDSRIELCNTTNEEKLFIAGFYTAKNIKGICSKLGIEK